MRARSFELVSGRLIEGPGPRECPTVTARGAGGYWCDVAGADPEEKGSFLGPLKLPPAMIERCLDRSSDAGVITAGSAILMEYRAPFDSEAENRMNDLYRDYQVVSSDRVEKRLRVLTVISAITLPLGLLTGLPGMNVGGLPGTSVWYGFLVVVAVMVVLFAVELWYLKHKGWFD